MKNNVTFQILIIVGVLNALTLIVSSLIGPNSYTIANNVSEYFGIILCYIPLTLLAITTTWFFINSYYKNERQINYFLLAFTAILSDAVFAIGTILFASNH
ncbi:MAG: hypothetical protein ACOVQC_06575 [Flavobacterium sp.]